MKEMNESVPTFIHSFINSFNINFDFLFYVIDSIETVFVYDCTNIYKNIYIK
jgi:hypothetical protein